VQARQALGLGIDQIAPSSNQQPDLEVELGGGLDRPQIGAGAHLVGDSARIAGVGLVLATDRALAGAVNGQAGHMDEGEPGRCEHGFGQACDTTDDIQADADGAAERTELVGKTGDIRRCVQQLAVDLHDAVGVDGSDPMDLLGDIASTPP